MKKKKIIHLLQSNKYSGAESVVCQIIESMNVYSTAYEMIYVSPYGPIQNVLKKKKIAYFVLNRFSQKEIDRAIKELNPDIIHAHDFNASVRVAKYKDKIIISHLHNNPLWFSKLDYRTVIYTLCLNSYKKIIGVSESVKKEYLFSKLIDKKFVLLPNVVDREKIIRMSKEQNDLSSDLLYVGRLSKEKDPLSFLKIIQKLVVDNKDVKAIMIGEGELYNECKNFIDRNSLQDNVNMLGFVENPYKYMKKTKLLVMTSVYEGFGLVAVEAMSLGVPVICRPVGGLVDIVNNDRGAFCKTIDEFTTTLQNLLSNNSEIIIRKDNAIKKSIQFCDLTKYRLVLQSLYNDTKKSS